MKVIHVITGGKGRGGAEGALLRLINETSSTVEHHLYTLLDMPDYIEDFNKVGVEVKSLNINKSIFHIKNIFYFIRDVKKIKPDVIQTWMHHSNLLIGLLGKFLRIPVIWNVRQSNCSRETLGSRKYLIVKTTAFLSKFIPYKIINCSLRSICNHEKIGYANKSVYIPNGCNVINKIDSYGYDNKVDFCVGSVARFDPIKNHPLFIGAFCNFNLKNTASYALMVGTGINKENKSLIDLLENLNLESFKLLGQTKTESELLNAYKTMSCLVLSSLAEGFPNVLIEAMSLSIPCISTDVGDAAEIIGDTGWVVASGDQVALEKALNEAYQEWSSNPIAWQDRKKRAHQRVLNNYSTKIMCDKYIQIWQSAKNLKNR